MAREICGGGVDLAGGRSCRGQEAGSGPVAVEESQMSQYLLSVHMVEGEGYPSEEEMQQAFKDVDALNEDIKKAGAWVFAGGLEPADTATVVREQNGDILTTDGPFIEGKEHIGGFWVIQVADLDEALAWAKKATVACRGAVEVRPFQEDTES
jgi:hypothetical protein